MWLFFVSIFSASAMVEVGSAVSYRKSSVNSENYQVSSSVTGSVSYYFSQNSAVELSYTNGSGVILIQPIATAKTRITSNFEMIGLDYVLSVQEGMIQPFVKFGAAYIKKQFEQNTDVASAEQIPMVKGFVPSAGLGVKLNLTKSFSFKIGIDAWTSPLQSQPILVDYAGRAGLSFLL